MAKSRCGACGRPYRTGSGGMVWRAALAGLTRTRVCGPCEKAAVRLIVGGPKLAPSICIECKHGKAIVCQGCYIAGRTTAVRQYEEAQRAVLRHCVDGLRPVEESGRLAADSIADKGGAS